MNDEHERKYKKLCAFALIAIVFALIAYAAAIAAQTTADNNANITNVFEIFVNNTNLAPTFPGEDQGTGERVTGVNYTNSNYPIELFVWAHANSSGQTAEVHLFINGSKVSDTSGRPIGIAESSNKTIVAIIPKNSIYSVEFVNDHHYEWREYPILSGRNGTTINISGATGNHSQLTNLNWSVAGHVMNDDITFITPKSIFNVSFIGNPCGASIICSYIQFNGTSPILTVDIGANNGAGTSTHIVVNPNNITMSKNGVEKMAINSSGNITMSTTFDIQNNSIINFNFTSSGSYIGDGTTNRSISYNLNGRTASKIDISSSFNSGNYYGQIIQPGYIYDIPTRNRTSVTQHTQSLFYVSGNFNQFSGTRVFEIGDTTSTGSSLVGNIRLFPITFNVTGNSINISINSQSAAGNVRMALYTDNAGVPLTLLNETASTPLINGFTNISLVTPVVGTTYWIGTQYDNNSETIYFNGSGNMKFKAQAYGTFPATLSGLSSAAVTHNERVTVIADTATYYWVAI